MHTVALLLPGLLASVVSAASLPSLENHNRLIKSRATPSEDCADSGVHIVTAPGLGGGGTNYGLIGSLVDAIQNAIPNSNNYLVGPYTGDSQLDNTVSSENLIGEHISAYSSKCPNTKIVLVGYSAGAIGSMNFLCGASPSPPWPASSSNWNKYNIIAYAGYGDETFQSGRPYDTGTCTTQTPKSPRTDDSACSGFFSKMRSYCDNNDEACCEGATDPNGHFGYPSIYDAKIAEWIAGLV